MSDAKKELAPGWYVQLLGDKFDLEDWEYTLQLPFDPVAVRDGDENLLLSSNEFATAANAEEVRGKALGLIAQLNGAMAIMHSAKPVSVGAIYRVKGDGSRDISVFAEVSAIAIGRARGRAIAVLMGGDGKPVPPPPPQPSDAQTWCESGATDTDIAALLAERGKADDWYGIYKTIEIAEAVASISGKTQNLAKMLGPSKMRFEQLRQTANYYRHATTVKPADPVPMDEAKPLLNFVVRTVLGKHAASELPDKSQRKKKIG